MLVGKERKPQRISEDREIRERLEFIREMLGWEASEEWPLGERASLEIESIWLEFRTGEITSEERQSCLQEKLDIWEKEEPDLFNWLIDDNGNGNRLSRIRDRAIPPRERRSLFS